MTRTCQQCGTILPTGAHTLTRYCKPCNADRQRARARRWHARTHGKQTRPTPKNRNCEICETPLPENAHNRLRYCQPCGKERTRARDRVAWQKYQARTRPARVGCKECDRTLVSIRTKTTGLCWECGSKQRAAELKAKREAVEAKEEQAAAAVVADAEAQAEWQYVLKRAARNNGPEFASKLAMELNKHRRLNGLPEVSL